MPHLSALLRSQTRGFKERRHSAAIEPFVQCATNFKCKARCQSAAVIYIGALMCKVDEWLASAAVWIQSIDGLSLTI